MHIPHEHAIFAVLVLAAAPAGCRTSVRPRTSGQGIPPADFYVAQNGNDAWSGKLPAPNAARTDGPFASLERARDAVRRIKPRSQRPIVVLVRGGEYRRAAPFELGAADSGTPGSPVVYRACPGEEVRITGGVRVPPTAFRPVTDPDILRRLPPEARSHVLQADLGAIGITDLGTWPVRFRGAPNVPELFFDDRPMTPARWPNDGWAVIRKIVDTGSIPRTGDKTNRGGVFEYDGDRPARWNVDSGVWLRGYWCFDWFAEAIRVKTIDPQTHRIQLAAPTVYGVRQGNPSPRRWYAFNLLEELDRPGEYYIDQARKILYFYPPRPLDENVRIVLSALDAPVVRIQDASHIRLRGLIFEATRDTAVVVNGGEDVRIQACEVRNCRRLGIDVQGGKRHVVEACDIHDTGVGGVVLTGGDRRTLTPGGHQVRNCRIWRFSRLQLTYANAVLLKGVGHRAAHNLIHDAPHQAIGIHGNDHVFEYNIVHDVCMETDDCGAFYKGRNPSCRGNIVRWNFWYNIGSPMGHGNAAVYFDDGDGGDTVYGNIFFRCGEPGRGSFGTVFSHGGFGNLAENNVFINCRRALGSSPWNFKRWKGFLDSPLMHRRLREEVDITRPPYTTRYPELVGFLDPKPDQVRVNRAVRNVFVMCGAVSSGNWKVDPKENLVLDHDPGFADAARGDFRLRPDSEVFRRLPGFRPIPFEKIGLTPDDLRPKVVREPWRFGPPDPLPPLPPPGTQKKRYAPPPKTGPKPVFRAPRRSGALVVDGRVEEWSLASADSARILRLDRDVSGNPVPPNAQSRASVAWDDRGLYVAVENFVPPDSPLDSDRWGHDDAVEIALRIPGAKQIFVVRGFGNETCRFGVTDDPADEPEPRKAPGLRYAARKPAADRWTAEFFIPFRLIWGERPAPQRIEFNLTVRKAALNLWLMWEPTQAHSYDVARAGLLELVR